MPQLFVYGSLIEKKYQTEVLGRELLLTPHNLKNYKKVTILIEGSPWFVATYTPGHTIKGYVTNVTASELKLLDAWEGSNYRRVKAEGVYFYSNVN